ncbi:MAG: D-alanine--D-alanine ligase [Clostridia bacterium]|nr:D-alanine--D-alanine ligase [Clostridia bacterium]
MNILVLAGGLSTERNVSLTSGSLVSAALRRRGHRVLMVDVFEGIKIDGKITDEIFTLEQGELYSVSEEVPDLDALRTKRGGRGLVGDNVLELCLMADVVYIALHGAMGENGQLQAMFDNLGVKYTGNGYIGSLLAMDKDLTKKMLVSAGVATPPWIYSSSAEYDADGIIEKIGLPCVVKPATGGSSVGVSIVNTREELQRAFDEAKLYEACVLVEKKIEGREFTCGILSDRTLPPVEIIPKQGFYDYKNKYQKGATTEICPAPLDEAQTEAIYDATRRAAAALRLSDYARFDFIMDANGVFWCLEANTLPGMTPTSLFPQEAAAVGIGYDELCDRIAHLGLKER